MKTSYSIWGLLLICSGLFTRGLSAYAAASELTLPLSVPMLPLGAPPAAPNPAISPCNLVTNPSFDTQVSVPTGAINNVGGFTAAETDVAAWVSTDLGSADYYAANAPTGSGANPASATFGSFSPTFPIAGGHNGCVGLFALSHPQTSPYREYVSQQLAAPLKNGTSYYVRFSAYLAAASGHTSTLTLNLTYDNPAPLPPQASSGLGNYTPGPYSITSPVLTQRAWTRVEGIITIPAGDSPPAPPRYVNIGGMSTSFGAASPVGFSSDGAYYYIDDVAIYEIPVARVPMVNYSCFGSAGVDIGSGCSTIPGAGFTWTTTKILGGSATSGLPPSVNTVSNHVNPTEPQRYTLTVTLPNSTPTNPAEFTTYVDVFPSDWVGLTAQVTPYYTNLPTGSTVCKNSTIVLVAQNQVSMVPFTWTVNGVPPASSSSTYSFGSTSSNNVVSITPALAGTYVIGVTAMGTCSQQPVTNTFTFTCSSVPCQPRAAVLTPQPAISPNPATDYLNLPEGVQQADIIDAVGNPHIQQARPGTKLDVRSLPAGVYLLRVITTDGKPQTRRLIIQH